MKAVVIEEFGGPEKLKMKEIEKPIPEANEVLIKLAFAGVNPVDWKVREGLLKSRMPYEFPIILGWDAAGTVVEVGKEVKELKVGDEVFAYVRKPLMKWGTYAEYVAYNAKDVAKKPKNLSFAEAASIPLGSLTAWQSLFDAAHLKRGESVLIIGGSGGVGSMALQFAKNAGAMVITTASPKKHDYVKKLGSDVAIDYKDNFAQHLKMHAKAGVDVVFDCVGGESFQKGIDSLKKGGRIVSLLEQLDPKSAERLGIQSLYVFVSPNGKQLSAISKLLEEKKVIPPHIEEMPLKDAGKAQEKLRKGLVFGKVVLKI